MLLHGTFQYVQSQISNNAQLADTKVHYVEMNTLLLIFCENVHQYFIGLLLF